MKHKETELDVDFIGGVRSLTKEDEQAISEYLKAKKLFRAKKNLRKATIRSRKKATA